jgi:hypothetical protein
VSEQAKPDTLNGDSRSKKLVMIGGRVVDALDRPTRLRQSEIRKASPGFETGYPDSCALCVDGREELVA